MLRSSPNGRFEFRPVGATIFTPLFKTRSGSGFFGSIWLLCLDHNIPRQCSFLHDHCIETEHHGLSQALTEEWSPRLYIPGTVFGIRWFGRLIRRKIEIKMTINLFLKNVIWKIPWINWATPGTINNGIYWWYSVLLQLSQKGRTTIPLWTLETTRRHCMCVPG